MRRLYRSGHTVTSEQALRLTGICSFWEYFSHSLRHIKAFVSNHQFNPIQAMTTQSREEAAPAEPVCFHTLGNSKNLMVSVLIHHNCHQNGHIFKLSASISAQLESIHIDIQIIPTLQSAIPPILNAAMRLLIQLIDGSRRHLAAPQSLGNILHASDRYTCQVHLNESFLYIALPAAISLNYGSLKRDPLEPGHI